MRKEGQTDEQYKTELFLLLEELSAKATAKHGELVELAYECQRIDKELLGMESKIIIPKEMK